MVRALPEPQGVIVTVAFLARMLRQKGVIEVRSRSWCAPRSGWVGGVRTVPLLAL